MTRTKGELGFRRWAAGLFDQQMWCLGRDIVRPAGNVLLDLGMCQYRPRDPQRGNTLYTAAVAPVGSVFLWGFGALYAEPGFGGVFLRRYDFAPKWTAHETALGVHNIAGLGRLEAPAAGKPAAKVRQLLPRLVGWFAKYEHWVAENLGGEYRADSLAGREKPSVAPATGMADAWERAAKLCKRFRATPPVATTPWARWRARVRSPAVRPVATRVADRRGVAS